VEKTQTFSEKLDNSIKENIMPKVGTKQFGYNPSGRLAAQRESRRTGRPLRESGGSRGQNTAFRSGPNMLPQGPQSLGRRSSLRPRPRPGMPPRPRPGIGNQGVMGGSRPGVGMRGRPGANRPQGSGLRKPGSGGSRRMGTPGMGSILNGRNKRRGGGY
jgi:hypothetical protein